MSKEKLNTVPSSYRDATGPIDVTLRNDMMFHRVMQNSKAALKGLVCSLKGLNPDTVKDVTLTNPIDYSAYANKEIILDVKVELNNSELLDIELQLYQSPIWERRSLLYLCRTFDNLGVGENYLELKPTTLIAIMDNSLFPDYPEFYSHYQFLNVKNYRPYSTLLNINVLYLSQINIATDEDKANNLVYWAKLFQTSTWEDMKKLCEVRPEFKEVAEIMYKSSIQPQEKTLYEAHQKFLSDKISLYSAGFEKAKEEDKVEIEALSSEIARLKKKLEEAGISAE